MKAPAKQSKTAPAQVRDGEAIEGVLDRHAEFSDDPIFPHPVIRAGTTWDLCLIYSVVGRT